MWVDPVNQISGFWSQFGFKIGAVTFLFLFIYFFLANQTFWGVLGQNSNFSAQ